jgi:hypothetical protein
MDMERNSASVAPAVATNLVVGVRAPAGERRAAPAAKD